jgi:PhnB protein
MQTQIYLFFDGCCEEAVKFYQRAVGAQLEMLMRFNEAPDPPPADCLAPGFENKVMHTSFRIGDTQVMASDGSGTEVAGFTGFSLSLAVDSVEQADRYFDALSEGGSVVMPLGQTFWSPRFGMLKDRFGVSWMVNMVAPCGAESGA